MELKLEVIYVQMIKSDLIRWSIIGTEPEDKKFREELKQEIRLDLLEQYGGSALY